jgi:hypothetical protein
MTGDVGAKGAEHDCRIEVHVLKAIRDTKCGRSRAAAQKLSKQLSCLVGNRSNYFCKLIFVDDVVARLTWHPHNLPIYRSGVVALRLEKLKLDKHRGWPRSAHLCQLLFDVRRCSYRHRSSDRSGNMPIHKKGRRLASVDAELLRCSAAGRG